MSKFLVIPFTMLLTACSLEQPSLTPTFAGDMGSSTPQSTVGKVVEPTGSPITIQTQEPTVHLSPALVTPTLGSIPYPISSQTPIIPTPTNTPALIPTEMTKPTEPLDRTSVDSVMRWFHYALVHGDLSTFQELLHEWINYMVFGTDVGTALQAEEFLDELAGRLPNSAICVGYQIQSGSINTIRVFTSGWKPLWDIEGAESTGNLVLTFSDQFSEEGKFSLIIASRAPVADPFAYDEIQQCP